MKLTPEESRFLTALAREQNQSGCRGPAHDLLRKHAYPDAPVAGPGSLAFAYEAVPLTSVLIMDFTEVQEIDDFLRKGDLIPKVTWPWPSLDKFQERLNEARQDWTIRRAAGSNLGSR